MCVCVGGECVCAGDSVDVSAEKTVCVRVRVRACACAGTVFVSRCVRRREQEVCTEKWWCALLYDGCFVSQVTWVPRT